MHQGPPSKWKTLNYCDGLGQLQRNEPARKRQRKSKKGDTESTTPAINTEKVQEEDKFDLDIGFEFDGDDDDSQY